MPSGLGWKRADRPPAGSGSSDSSADPIARSVNADVPQNQRPSASSVPSGAGAGLQAATGAGFEGLVDAILHRLGGDDAIERDDLMITDARQHAAVTQAIAQLNEARDLMIERELEEIVLLKLHSALQSIGEISGETLTDDILGQIFSTFCIGK